jgi:hypothetical protein
MIAHAQTVLAGLSPATIIEIAGRALGFWTYQISQQGCAHGEIGLTISAFQNMLLRNHEKVIAKKDQEVVAGEWAH